MFRFTPRLSQLGSAILLLFLAFSSAQAAPVVNVHPDESGVSFSTSKKHSGAKICITGPDGFVLEKRGASVADLNLHEDLADGVYSYEVTFDSMVKRSRREGGESSMQARKTPDSIAAGAFTVVNGVALNPNIKE